MLHVTTKAAELAFIEYDRHYVRAVRKWDFKYKHSFNEMCSVADKRVDFDRFCPLIAEMRSHWQAFRGKKVVVLPDQEIFSVLRDADPFFRASGLRDVTLDDVPSLHSALKKCATIKTNKNGPSVVAMSKMLHCWNPALFPVVDQGVVWNLMFSNLWLWEDFEKTRVTTDDILGIRAKRNDASCDVSSYVAFIVWTSNLLQQNASIMSAYKAYVRRECARISECDGNMNRLEAVAAEWVLLGLVQLIPEGVTAS